MAEGSKLLVVARDLQRSFAFAGQKVGALASASFEIASTDRIALAGPSGSGKSTLLALIAGLDKPDVGTIAWPGLPGRSSQPVGLASSDIALAFQAPSLIPSLTVIANAALPHMLRGGGAGEAEERAAAALSLFRVQDLADKLPEEISGGQAQRVVLARCIVARPDLILADEPTSQLDHLNGMAAIEALLGWTADNKCAVVIATHDVEVARRLDRTWTIYHGLLDTVGPLGHVPSAQGGAERETALGNGHAVGRVA
ncbi:ABC transporter ATP-binding protein [Labrys miyagiensis]|uniref:ABC transporter ATP-binding protein n=1 Tax=Labrys miyagiensis TaxID=346912 RepID=A0ABQ6CC99_9HYPH|nr:ABC transporter ATP-binding protein [Labrys miyagiensis]GLS17434.1 ABC transporter ATP-binding protein [Labrys miyagiensis]